MLICLAVTAALTFQDAPKIEGGTEVPENSYRIEVVADGLENPWNMSWLPSGDILVTERAGRLRIIRDDALLPTPVEGLPNVYANSQAGLFEVELHPDYDQNGWLYLTYACGSPRSNTLCLARAQFIETEASGRLEKLEVLFEAEARRNSSAHYGGRMAWLPDHTLLLTSGEGYRYKTEAQKLDTHFGKILRLTDTGQPVPDNPFVDQDGALPEIWSYGHRNPQGIVVTPDGTVYSNEHGPKGGDELNHITPGTNYGWPVITYGIDYSGAEITPFTARPGMAQPIWHWTPSIAPSSLLFYDGNNFPQWWGKLMSSALVFKDIRIADPETPDATQEILLAPHEMRVRDLALSPDGTLYVATEKKNRIGGEILRILPEE